MKKSIGNVGIYHGSIQKQNCCQGRNINSDKWKGENNLRAFDKLTCVLADMQNLGYEIILVSSGAIAIGANKLKLKSRPRTMRMKQAAAAVGQCSIMYLYDKFFSDYDKTTAQILLNAEDM